MGGIVCGTEVLENALALHNRYRIGDLAVNIMELRKK